MVAKKRTTRKSKDSELDALYEGVMTCKPVVDPADMEELADRVFSKGHLIRAWRMAALVGSKDGAFFKGLSTESDQAKALAAFVDPMRSTAELLRCMAKIMDCISTRIVVAGCNHEQFNEWMEASHV